MTAYEISERLWGDGLVASDFVEYRDANGKEQLPAKVSGPLSAWQKALGPTREQISAALFDALKELTDNDKVGTYQTMPFGTWIDISRGLLACLYP